MPQKKPVSILAIEDHEIVRFALTSLFGEYPEFKYIGDGANAASALEIAKREQPDIILLDLMIDDNEKLDLISKLLQISKDSKIVVLIDSNNHQDHADVIRAGARGVVQKTQAFDILILAFETVINGDIWLDKKIYTKIFEGFGHLNQIHPADEDRVKIKTLSKRELEVINVLCEGLKNKEIADRLFISAITVRHHLSTIFGKLGVSDRVELIIFSYRHGLAEIPPALGTLRNPVDMATHAA